MHAFVKSMFIFQMIWQEFNAFWLKCPYYAFSYIAFHAMCYILYLFVYLKGPAKM